MIKRRLITLLKNDDILRKKFLRNFSFFIIIAVLSSLSYIYFARAIFTPRVIEVNARLLAPRSNLIIGSFNWEDFSDKSQGRSYSYNDDELFHIYSVAVSRDIKSPLRWYPTYNASKSSIEVLSISIKTDEEEHTIPMNCKTFDVIPPPKDQISLRCSEQSVTINVAGSEAPIIIPLSLPGLTIVESVIAFSLAYTFWAALLLFSVNILKHLQLNGNRDFQTWTLKSLFWNRRTLFSVILIIFIWGIIYFGFMSKQTMMLTDDGNYARSIRIHESIKRFLPDPYRTVGLHIIYNFVGLSQNRDYQYVGMENILILQKILVLISSLIIFFLAKAFRLKKAQILIPVYFLFHPYVINATFTGLPEIVLNSIGYLGFALIILTVRYRNFMLAILSGLVLGLATHIKPIGLVVLFSMLVILFIDAVSDKNSRMKIVRNILIIIFCYALAISPWLIYNNYRGLSYKMEAGGKGRMLLSSQGTELVVLNQPDLHALYIEYMKKTSLDHSTFENPKHDALRFATEYLNTNRMFLDIRHLSKFERYHIGTLRKQFRRYVQNEKDLIKWGLESYSNYPLQISMKMLGTFSSQISLYHPSFLHRAHWGYQTFRRFKSPFLDNNRFIRALARNGNFCVGLYITEMETNTNLKNHLDNNFQDHLEGTFTKNYWNQTIYENFYEYIYALYLVLWKVIAVLFLLSIVLFLINPTAKKAFLLVPPLAILAIVSLLLSYTRRYAFWIDPLILLFIFYSICNSPFLQYLKNTVSHKQLVPSDE